MLIQLISLVALALDICVRTCLYCIREIDFIVSHKSQPSAIPLPFFALILATCQSKVLRDIIKYLGKLSDFD